MSKVTKGVGCIKKVVAAFIAWLLVGWLLQIAFALSSILVPDSLPGGLWLFIMLFVLVVLWRIEKKYRSPVR